MFLIEQRRLIAPLFLQGPVTGRLIDGALAQNSAGSAIGVAQFSMPFNGECLEIKTIESAGHPVAWSPKIAEWVSSNLAVHKSVTLSA